MMGYPQVKGSDLLMKKTTCALCNPTVLPVRRQGLNHIGERFFDAKWTEPGKDIYLNGVCVSERCFEALVGANGWVVLFSPGTPTSGPRGCPSDGGTCMEMRHGNVELRGAGKVPQVNKEIADSVRGLADHIASSDHPANITYHWCGSRTMFITNESDGNLLFRVASALVDVSGQLDNLTHGEVTVKVQDGRPVAVEVLSKHKPTPAR